MWGRGDRWRWETRLVAVDGDSPAEFVIEVIEVIDTVDEVYYRLRRLADMDPAAEPGLDGTRSWLPPSQ